MSIRWVHRTACWRPTSLLLVCAMRWLQSNSVSLLQHMTAVRETRVSSAVTATSFCLACCTCPLEAGTHSLPAFSPYFRAPSAWAGVANEGSCFQHKHIWLLPLLLEPHRVCIITRRACPALCVLPCIELMLCAEPTLCHLLPSLRATAARVTDTIRVVSANLRKSAMQEVERPCI